MKIDDLLSMDEIHASLEYVSMRYDVIAKIRKALKPDMAIITLSDTKSSNNECYKYRQLIEHKYNDIEALQSITNDVFKYWQMIVYHKYANYFAIEPERTLHNMDINYSMYDWDESTIEVLTVSVSVSEISYDSVAKMLSFDFEKFIDNYFADISKFIEKYNMLIGDEGNQCIISKGDVHFRLNRNTKSNIHRLLTSAGNTNFKLKNKQILENIYQYFPDNKEVI